MTPARAAADARRELKRLARPAGDVDPRRYFRGAVDLGFYNVGTETMRYLRAHGPAIPRTTVRYAIERFPAAMRRSLLTETRPRGI